MTSLPGRVCSGPSTRTSCFAQDDNLFSGTRLISSHSKPNDGLNGALQLVPLGFGVTEFVEVFGGVVFLFA
jgi:hypothetical protein